MICLIINLIAPNEETLKFWVIFINLNEYSKVYIKLSLFNSLKFTKLTSFMNHAHGDIILIFQEVLSNVEN